MLLALAMRAGYRAWVCPSICIMHAPCRHLPVVDLLVDTPSELFDLAMRSGLRLFAQCSRKTARLVAGRGIPIRSIGAPADPARLPSEVVLGGRKVPIQRPRVRTTKGEAPAPRLKRWRTPIRWIDASSSRCPSAWRLGSMRGAWNRVAPTSTVVAPPRERRRRRFAAKTRAQFETWQAAQLDDLALV